MAAPARVRYTGGPLIADCTICGERINVVWTSDEWEHAILAVEKAAGHVATPPKRERKWLTLRCPQCHVSKDVLPGSSGWCEGNGRHKPVQMVEV